MFNFKFYYFKIYLELPAPPPPLKKSSICQVASMMVKL